MAKLNSLDELFLALTGPTNIYDRIEIEERLRDPVSQCEMEYSPDSACGLRVRAPSDMHAWLFLVHQNLKLLSGQAGSKRAPMFFRGQPNSNWDLIASIHRSGVKVDEEVGAAQAFASLLGHYFVIDFIRNGGVLRPALYTNADNVPEELYVATGQHYGLRTAFLDFTLDPAVAVWFACQQSLDNRSTEASVFGLPSPVVEKVGAHVVIPHPYVRRPFRQRGVFIRPDTVPNLKQWCIEVRFPPNPEFVVWRSGKPVNLLGGIMNLPGFGRILDLNTFVNDAEYWWLLQVDTARKLVRDGRLQELLRLPTGSAEASFGGLLKLVDNELDPPFEADRLIQSSVDDLLEMLLAFATVDEAGQVTFSPTAIQMLKGGGEFTLSRMIPYLRDYANGLPDKIRRTSATALVANLEAAIPSWLGT